MRELRHRKVNSQLSGRVRMQTQADTDSGLAAPDAAEAQPRRSMASAVCLGLFCLIPLLGLSLNHSLLIFSMPETIH